MFKLPIGIQDFTALIEDGYAYIDKTEQIHSLISQGFSYFFSRP
jgi:Predicted AAA-ATPase